MNEPVGANPRYVSGQTVREFTYIYNDELERLHKIEAAATAWRRSLEDDGWLQRAIEEGVCRPGMAELMKLIPANDR